MQINFVTELENERWILRKWCEQWSKLIPGSTITALRADKSADANIYVNYALYSGSTNLDIAYFTHREFSEEEGASKFDKIAEQVDFCLAQSQPTFEKLPAWKTMILEPGVDDIFRKGAIRLGVVGRNYRSGRKNLGLANRLAAEFSGKLDVVFTEGKLSETALVEFYRSVDYILVTSNNEGGPMSIIEAIAMGKPTIAPEGVGWCSKYATIVYTSEDNLLETIRTKVISNDAAWHSGAKQLIYLINKLLNEKTSATSEKNGNIGLAK